MSGGLRPNGGGILSFRTNEDNVKNDKKFKKVKDEQLFLKPHAPKLVTVIIESVMLTKCIPQLY